MQIRRLFGAVLSLGLVAAFAAPAQSQVLDDTWILVKASGKGYLVDDVSGEATKAKFSAVAYMHLTYVPPGAAELLGGGITSQSYEYTLWTEIDGVWTESETDTVSMFGTNEHLFVSDHEFIYMTGAVANFGGYQAAEFKNTLDDEGGLKKCKYKSLGAELIDGTETGDETAVGGYKAKGKSIDPAKLPFDPTPPV